jgi:hypothetical protein
LGTETAELAVDKAKQKRIIAGTSERKSHPLKYPFAGWRVHFFGVPISTHPFGIILKSTGKS